jgi:hypothetical protein
MIAYQILKGLASHIPGAYATFARKRTGGTDSARYCYAVWMRHLVMAHQNGLSTCPEVVAELGPGDSLGAGLAALLSGASRYYALDAVDYASTKSNLTILDELISLFRNRAPIPDEEEFPDVKPFLETYDFPNGILTEDRLKIALDPKRLNRVRSSVADVASGESMVRYVAPWNEASVIDPDSVDMVFSQAVLEHVNDLAGTYAALSLWLKPGAFMSNQVDFRSHGTSKHWNGHWGYSPLTWKLITGNRPYVINRKPHSAHVELMLCNDFDVVSDIIFSPPDQSGIAKPTLKGLTDEDLRTSGAHFQAAKRSN